VRGGSTGEDGRSTHRSGGFRPSSERRRPAARRCPQSWGPGPPPGVPDRGTRCRAGVRPRGHQRPTGRCAPSVSATEPARKAINSGDEAGIADALDRVQRCDCDVVPIDRARTVGGAIALRRFPMCGGRGRGALCRGPTCTVSRKGGTWAISRWSGCCRTRWARRLRPGSAVTSFGSATVEQRSTCCRGSSTPRTKRACAGCSPRSAARSARLAGVTWSPADRTARCEHSDRRAG
jgi:hypothetical protein